MAATIDARVQEAGLPMASEAPQLDEVVTAMARYAAVSIVGSSLEAAARPPAGPGTTEWEACAAEFEGAVVFCDISGFTGLTERLAQSDDGVEQLVRFLNQYFGRLIRIVYSHGGDVLKFAGDAMLVVFGQPGVLASGEVDDLKTSAQRAILCAFEIMTTMNDPETSPDVLLHIGVGAGPMSLLQVGGTFKRNEPLLIGTPLTTLGPAVSAAGPDMTVLTSGAWRMVKDTVNCEQISYEGEMLYRLVDVDGLAVEPTPTKVDPLVLRHGGGTLEPEALPRFEQLLRAFIPGAIHKTIALGRGAVLPELRHLTVVFCNIIGLELETPACLSQVHAVVIALQESFYQYEGSLNKILLDDKGFVCLGAFGLPPVSHSDEALRGVLAAMLAKEKLDALGVQCSFGVTTGQAFCGIVGNAQRCEYTIMGDVVNLCARLMASTHDSILVDDATMAGARSRVEFDTHAPRKLKGKKNPITTHSPRIRDGQGGGGSGSRHGMFQRRRGRKVKSIATMARLNVSLVGRHREVALLKSLLDDLVDGSVMGGSDGAAAGGAGGGAGHVIVVEGESGVGKGRLLEEVKVMAQAVDDKVIILGGAGDSVEKHTPFYPWRDVFAQLFDLSSSSTMRRRDNVLGRFLHNKFLFRWAPLFNSVLSLDIPDTEETAALQGASRMDKTQEVLIESFKMFSEGKRVVLLLQDLHKFDARSRSMAIAIGSDCPDVLMVVSTAPLPTPVPPDYSALITDPEKCTVLKLKPLAEAAIVKLVCERLGVREIPPILREVIVARCAGNPFFAQELAMSLLASGTITVEDRACVVAPGINTAADVALPDSLRGVVTSRIDRLSPEEGLVLKVASALGRNIDCVVLAGVVPVVADVFNIDVRESDLATAAARLMELDLVVNPDLIQLEAIPERLMFSKPFIRDVVYTQMTFNQRQRIHKIVAEYIEASLLASDLSDPLNTSLLANHWLQTDLTDPHNLAKALSYLRSAADTALFNDRYKDCMVSVDAALALVARGSAAHVEFLVLAGEATLCLEDETKARALLTEALEALNPDDPPDTASMLVFDLLKRAKAEAAEPLKVGSLGRSGGSDLLSLSGSFGGSGSLGGGGGSGGGGGVEAVGGGVSGSGDARRKNSVVSAVSYFRTASENQILGASLRSTGSISMMGGGGSSAPDLLSLSGPLDVDIDSTYTRLASETPSAAAPAHDDENDDDGGDRAGGSLEARYTSGIGGDLEQRVTDLEQRVLSAQEMTVTALAFITGAIGLDLSQATDRTGGAIDVAGWDSFVEEIGRVRKELEAVGAVGTAASGRSFSADGSSGTGGVGGSGDGGSGNGRSGDDGSGDDGSTGDGKKKAKNKNKKKDKFSDNKDRFATIKPVRRVGGSASTPTLATTERASSVPDLAVAAAQAKANKKKKKGSIFGFGKKKAK